MIPYKFTFVKKKSSPIVSFSKVNAFAVKKFKKTLDKTNLL